MVWFIPMHRSKNLEIGSDIYWLRCPIIHRVVFFSLFWQGRFQNGGAAIRHHGLERTFRNNFHLYMPSYTHPNA